MSWGYDITCRCGRCGSTARSWRGGRAAHSFTGIPEIIRSGKCWSFIHSTKETTPHNFPHVSSFFFWLCHMACEILLPCSGVEPMLPAVKRGALTTGPWGKSPHMFSFQLCSSTPCPFFLEYNFYCFLILKFNRWYMSNFRKIRKKKPFNDL